MYIFQRFGIYFHPSLRGANINFQTYRSYMGVI